MAAAAKATLDLPGFSEYLSTIKYVYHHIGRGHIYNLDPWPYDVLKKAMTRMVAKVMNGHTL
jgi:hypothetical protein